MRPILRVGTRGSALALAQASEVIAALKHVRKGTRCEVVSIRTKGDEIRSLDRVSVDGKSIFTKEIEESLLERKIDLAVHSMKDLTTDLPEGLIIAGIPARQNPRDALISRSKAKFTELKGHARVGTSSARRKAQLLAARGDLEIVETRGNVDTRLRKLSGDEYDALVLAAAGLLRLGLEKHATEYLSTNVMLPAVGQGALAIQVREDDAELRELVSEIDHNETRRAVDAERAFARKLGADCRTPVAAYAKIESGKLAIDGMVAASNGRMLVRSRVVSGISDPAKIGEELAENLLSKGAAAILEAA
jgi:hydroxymethylbilane synthase